jgi:hypothetical protein
MPVSEVEANPKIISTQYKYSAMKDEAHLHIATHLKNNLSKVIHDLLIIKE